MPLPQRSTETPLPTSPSAADFQFHIGQPHCGLILRRTFRVLGWCLGLQAQNISALRAIVGGQTFSLRYGIKRTGIANAFPHLPQSRHCGFKGIISCEAEPEELILEAQVDCDWVEVGRFALKRVGLLTFSVVALRTAYRTAYGTTNAIPLSHIRRIYNAFRYHALPRVVNALRPIDYGDFDQYPARPVQLEKFPIKSTISLDQLPKFTIVTPSFNQAPFLESTIRSVLDQEDVRVDYLVLGGGSTDGSVEIIQRYSKELRYWISRKDNGQSAAIAEGFQLTDTHADETDQTDEIMAYLNSDDLLLPGALRFVAEYFHKHPEVDAVYGHRVLIDSTGLEIGRWFTPWDNAERLRYIDLIPQETLFWRRNLYRKVHGIDPSFRFAMDWDLLLRFSTSGAVMKRLPYFLGCFRIHPQSKTTLASSSIGAEECATLRLRELQRIPSNGEVAGTRAVAQLWGSLFEWLWKRNIRI